jgi:hypothetical protein
MLTQDARLAKVSAARYKYDALRPNLDERRVRLWAAAESLSIGRGGIAIVSEATGLARNTVVAGIKEIESGTVLPSLHSVRREGAGRKFLRDIDETLLEDLNALIEPTSRGDPQSPMRWTCKSLRKLASELESRGHHVCPETVSRLLGDWDYSLQSNRKSKEGGNHPDRNAQFEHINEQTKRFVQNGQPVISVDTKKKELIGDFKNAGREWRPQGSPEEVRVHDFIDPAQGKAVPYGVYDIGANSAWVSIGIDHDTAEFAINTILTWWHQMGRTVYPNATDLMITADGGGSNSSRSRLWKVELQRLANATSLKITVCHLPPGTSKWNKIEHRLFSYITQNWRGRPLVSHEAVVNLVGSTTTQTGLKVDAGLDTRQYVTGKAVPDEELSAVNLTKGDFHGDWNYTVAPTTNWPK